MVRKRSETGSSSVPNFVLPAVFGVAGGAGGASIGTALVANPALIVPFSIASGVVAVGTLVLTGAMLHRSKKNAQDVITSGLNRLREMTGYGADKNDEGAPRP